MATLPQVPPSLPRQAGSLLEAPHQEKLLQHPAVVLPQGQLVGFDGVHADQVGVLLILLAIGKALQQDLDELETPRGRGRGKVSERLPVPPALRLELGPCEVLQPPLRRRSGFAVTPSPLQPHEGQGGPHLWPRRPVHFLLCF